MRSSTWFLRLKLTLIGCADCVVRSTDARSCCSEPTPTERIEIGLYGNAVQLDRALDRFARQRQQPFLPCVAEHHDVRRHRVAEQLGREPRQIEPVRAVRSDVARDHLAQMLDREVQVWRPARTVPA